MTNHPGFTVQSVALTRLDDQDSSVDVATGTPYPDFISVPASSGIPGSTNPTECSPHNGPERQLPEIGPIVFNVEIAREQSMGPTLVFGRPLQNSNRLLPPAEFRASRTVRPIKVSGVESTRSRGYSSC